jgi:hypothetical protein
MKMTFAKMTMTPRTARTIVLSCAIVGFVVARVIERVCLSDITHVMDEIAYVFQGQTLARGHVAAPTALPRGAFNLWFVDSRAARHGIFPPGWPAFIAVGEWLHLTHWLNPIFHAVTTVLLARAARRLAGDVAAVCVGLFYATSAQAILLASSLMSHTLVALCAAVVLCAVAEMIAGGAPSQRLALAAGCALGVTAAARPLCACALGAFVALATFVAMRGGGDPSARRTARVAFFARFVVGALPATLLLLLYNRALTGSIFTFPQTLYFDSHPPPGNIAFFRYHPGCNSLGFGGGRGCDMTIGEGSHTLWNALSNTGDNVTAWLILACGGPLVFALPLVTLVKRASRRTALLLLALPLAVVTLYALYWHGGTCYGARLYHAGLGALVLAGALGAASLGPRLRAIAVGLVLVTNVAVLPSALKEMSDPTWGYWGVDDRFAQMKEKWDKGRAVVMVGFGADDLHNPKMGVTNIIPQGSYWMLNIRALGALAQNSPYLDDTVLFTKFHPALAQEIHERFPDRALYVYTMAADRAADTMRPYQTSDYPTDLARPKDNFDGYRIVPPLVQPDAPFRELE